jgi:hypothetical protein
MPRTRSTWDQLPNLQFLSGASSNYLGSFGHLRSSNMNASANVLYLTPFINFRPRMISTLGIGVTSAAAFNMRIGLFNADQETGLPTTLIVDAGIVSSGSSIGDKFITGLSANVSSGLDYFGIVFDAAGQVAGSLSYAGLLGNITSGVWQNINRRTTPFTYGALPSDLSSGFTFNHLNGTGGTNLAPNFGFK